MCGVPVDERDEHGSPRLVAALQDAVVLELGQAVGDRPPFEDKGVGIVVGDQSGVGAAEERTELSAALAAGLAARGTSRGDLVAVAMPNAAWWLVPR